MATISNAERNGIIDLTLTVCREDVDRAAVVLDMLQTGLPAIPWATIMRTRAAAWAPFVTSGLSISAWCDEVVRTASVYAAARA